MYLLQQILITTLLMRRKMNIFWTELKKNLSDKKKLIKQSIQDQLRVMTQEIFIRTFLVDDQLSWWGHTSRQYSGYCESLKFVRACTADGSWFWISSPSAFINAEKNASFWYNRWLLLRNEERRRCIVVECSIRSVDTSGRRKWNTPPII